MWKSNRESNGSDVLVLESTNQKRNNKPSVSVTLLEEGQIQPTQILKNLNNANSLNTRQAYE